MTFKPSDEITSGTRAVVLATLMDLKWHDAKSLHGEGGHNVSARIYELRQDGWDIKTRHGPSGFAQYRLESTTQGSPMAAKVQVLLTKSELRELLQDGTVPPSVLEKCAAAYERLLAKESPEDIVDEIDVDGWFD